MLPVGAHTACVIVYCLHLINQSPTPCVTPRGTTYVCKVKIRIYMSLCGIKVGSADRCPASIRAPDRRAVDRPPSDFLLGAGLHVCKSHAKQLNSVCTLDCTAMLPQRALAYNSCHRPCDTVAATAVGHLGHAPGANPQSTISAKPRLVPTLQTGRRTSLRYPKQLTRASYSQASAGDVSALCGPYTAHAGHHFQSPMPVLQP